MYLSNIIINILLKKVRKQKKLLPLKAQLSSHDREKSLDEERQIFHRKKQETTKYKMNSTKNECFKIRTLNHCYRATYYSFSNLSSMLQLVFWVSPRSSPKTVIILRTGHVATWCTCHWSAENVFFIINIASSLNTHHSTVKGILLDHT